jgi:two-component system, cell cycle response regulator CpdR
MLWLPPNVEATIIISSYLMFSPVTLKSCYYLINNPSDFFLVVGRLLALLFDMILFSSPKANSLSFQDGNFLLDYRVKAVKQMEDILVVDDDKIMLEAVKRILEREGIVAHCVASGEEALEKMKERTFSLMITDLNMSGLDGLELARKGLAIAPQMPIIMDTGAISPKIIRLAKEIGIAKVFGKPFIVKELLETIREVIGKRMEWASSTG